MLCEQVHTFEQCDVAVLVFQGMPYFRACDVTSALGYTDSAQAIRKNVNSIYVKTQDEFREVVSGAPSDDVSPGPNDENASTNLFTKGRGFKKPLYISEPGVYELIWHSKKPEALRFRQWIVEDVLPEIRKTGKFVRNEQMSLMCETDLHYKVIAFIRRFFDDAIIVAGLGELQDTSEKRIDAWKKGYTAGQPDILILNRTRKASGLAIELKTPLCQRNPSLQQEAFLKALQTNTFETLISNCYDEIVVKILEYREAVRRCIPRKRARSSVE